MRGAGVLEEVGVVGPGTSVMQRGSELQQVAGGRQRLSATVLKRQVGRSPSLLSWRWLAYTQLPAAAMRQKPFASVAQSNARCHTAREEVLAPAHLIHRVTQLHDINLPRRRPPPPAPAPQTGPVKRGEHPQRGPQPLACREGGREGGWEGGRVSGVAPHLLAFHSRLVAPGMQRRAAADVQVLA